MKWSVRGAYLAAWAFVGIFLWIPRLLGAVLLYAAALVQATVRGTSAKPAGRHLGCAADFYRSFVKAMESLHAGGEGAPAGEERPIELRPTLRNTAWGILVWYVMLWPAGIVQPPAELASSLAAAPWSEMWSGALEAIGVIPGLFRG
jgi:hypothetical protein